MVKKFLGLLILGVIFIFQGCAMASDLVSDIKELREKDRSPRLDVSVVVGKHIQVDTAWEIVFGILTKDGFQCHLRVPQHGNADLKIYDCEIDLRHWYQFGFGDKLRLDITVKNEKVMAAGGEIIYLSL